MTQQEMTLLEDLKEFEQAIDVNDKKIQEMTTKVIELELLMKDIESKIMRLLIVTAIGTATFFVLISLITNFFIKQLT